MKETDVIFKIVKTDVNVDPNSFCYFGWEGIGTFALWKYACAYFDSANALYEKIQHSAGHYDIIDGLGIAMCFMYRHYVELIIKHLYVKFVCVDDEDYTNFLNIGHNLTELWNVTKPKLKELHDRVGSSISLGAVEHYIKSINKFDKESMSMRYPLDKKLQPMHPETRLDLANLHDRMNELYGAMVALSDGLDGQFRAEDYCVNDELIAFQSVYDDMVSRLIEITTDLQSMIPQGEQKEFGTNFFDSIKISSKNPAYEYLQELNDDEIMMCDILYYVGRSLLDGSLRLPIKPEDAKKDVLNECVRTMKRDHFEFGKHKNNEVNIYGKQVDGIVKCMQTTMEYLK